MANLKTEIASQCACVDPICYGSFRVCAAQATVDFQPFPDAKCQIDADWLRKVLADNPEAVKVIAEALASALTRNPSLRPSY